jgi:hypothetical protein
MLLGRDVEPSGSSVHAGSGPVRLIRCVAARCAMRLARRIRPRAPDPARHSVGAGLMAVPDPAGKA